MNASPRTANARGQSLAGSSVVTGDDPGIPQRQERLLLTIILLLAALLRLGWPGIVQFSLDEAQTTRLAVELAEGRGIPLFGTGTSFGLPTSPISQYVYVPAALLWDNPLWLTWFTAALNLIALVLFWQLSRRYWGARVALCAALVYATHPWAVMSSRKIWEPNLIAFFAIPWAITAALAFRERHPKALVAHLALLSVIAQMHYSGLALLPVTGVLLLLGRKWVDRRMLVAGLVVAGIIALPFVVGIVQTEGAGWRASSSFFSGQARVGGQSLRLWWITATGSDIHSLAGWPAYLEFLRTIPDLSALHKILGALVALGIGLWLREAWQRRHDLAASTGLLMSLWALAPLLLLIRHVRPLYLHYYVVSIPALCLAAGIVLGRLAAARLSVVRVAAPALLIVLAGAQSLTTVAILRFVGTYTTPGGFGVPLQSQLRAANRARALGPPLIVLAEGDDPRLSDWTAVFGVLAHGTPHRILDGSRLALFPGEPATVLLTPGTHTALQAYGEAGVLDLAEVIPNRRGEEPFRVLRLKGGLTPELRPASQPRRLAHGAEVLGYRVDGKLTPGQAFDWWLAWRVWRDLPHPRQRYQVFNHLLDETGTRLTQADGSTIPPHAWRVGDLVLQRFRLEVPGQARQGPLWMRVGMYTYPELQKQAVLDGNGQPAGEFVMLGPLGGE